MRRPRPTTLILSAILGTVGFVPTHVFSQNQPTDATNAQDEVVNVVKDVTGEDLTIFRTGDKAERNRYVSQVVELFNTAALEVMPNVRAAVRLEKGTASPLKYVDPETGKMRHFIQVVTTADQMPSVVETIKSFDIPGLESSTGDIKFHYRMSYRRASEVAQALAGSSLSGDGSVFFDDTINTVYFQDSVSDGRRNIEVIKFYDVPAPQVEFEVVAIEIDEDNGSKLGIDWDFWKESLGGQIEFTGNAYEGGDNFGRIDALMTIDARALASFLNYTVSTGTARVSTRTVLTASNEDPAIFSSLRRIPSAGYLTVYSDPKELIEETPGVDARRVDDNNRYAPGKRPVAIVAPSRSTLVRGTTLPSAPGPSAQDPSTLVGEKSEGVYLAIRPTIGRALVTADVRAVVNSLVGMSELGEPIISERLVDTRVTLEDGKPFTLGGLVKESNVDYRKGIPLLKEIPLIKYLFSVNTKKTLRTKIYLIITPRYASQLVYNAASLTGAKLSEEPAYTANPALPAMLIDAPESAFTDHFAEE